MIRKSGWLVFIVMFAALLAIVYVVAGPAIRLGMVYSLEKATGAEVNIDNVSLKLAPLGISIHNLQLTDATNPEYNSLSFSNANAAIEVWPALLGYYVIDDLSIQDVAYGTKRQQPGQVYRKPDAVADSATLSDMLQTNLPSADELLARANLQTPAKAEALQSLAAAEQAQLKALQQQLPDKATLAQYQADIKALTDSKIKDAADLATKTQQLTALKEKLQAEKAKVMQVAEQLRQSKDKLQQAVTELQQASTADWQKVQQLANLSNGGLAGISQLLLGNEWAARLNQLNTLYQLAKPYIPQKTADAAAEAELLLPNRILPLPSQPYPNFWVKHASINWLLGGGNIAMNMQDITAQHSIINKPTTFELAAKDMPQLSSFTLQGDFAILQQMIANMSWKLDGMGVQDMTFGSGDNLLALTRGLVNSSGKLNLTDDQLTQQATFQLNNGSFNSSGNKYLQQLSSMLNKQSSIPLNIRADGLISQPDIHISSSLDKVLGDELLGEAKQKVAALQSNLKAKLDSQLQSGLAGQQDWSALLTQQEGETNEASGSIEKLLSSQLAGVTDKAKDKLKEKLMGKLGGG